MKSYLIKCIAASFSMLCAGTQVLAQSNLLHYNRPAQYFEEALPIGNGNLGAMIYGGVDEDKLSLNDITLWTGEPDTKVYAPEAYKTIPLIREALDKGDYCRADELQRKVQGHYSESFQPLGCLRIASSQKETANQIAPPTKCMTTMSVYYCLLTDVLKILGVMLCENVKVSFRKTRSSLTHNGIKSNN